MTAVKSLESDSRRKYVSTIIRDVCRVVYNKNAYRKFVGPFLDRYRSRNDHILFRTTRYIVPVNIFFIFFFCSPIKRPVLTVNEMVVNRIIKFIHIYICVCIVYTTVVGVFKSQCNVHCVQLVYSRVMLFYFRFHGVRNNRYPIFTVGVCVCVFTRLILVCVRVWVCSAYNNI